MEKLLETWNPDRYISRTISQSQARQTWQCGCGPCGLPSSATRVVAGRNLPAGAGKQADCATSQFKGRIQELPASDFEIMRVSQVAQRRYH